MSQVTVTKPAAKSAKPAVKRAAKATQAAAPAVTNVLTHGLHNGYRPGAGRLLFAFTDAWLKGTGLAAGGTVPREVAEKIAGGTAIAYHLGNGNLSDTKGALALTSKGVGFFSARGVDAKMSEAFLQALRTGAPDAAIGLKSAGAFRPLA